jgi:flagellar motility protein MotE (MotC chaperone)
MNATVKYIVTFSGSMLVVALLTVGAAFVKPEVFSLATNIEKHDSTHVDTGRTVDSTQSPPANTPLVAEESGEAGRDAHHADSLQVLKDSVTKLGAALDTARIKVQQLSLQLGSLQRTTDSTKVNERKVFAKFLSGMTAEDAARILKNLSDQEAKEALMIINKNQAGKILSTMEPERVARLMR